MKTMTWLAAIAAVGVCATAGAGSGDSRVSCRVDLDRGVLPAGSAQKAVVKVTLEAPPAPKSKAERPPVNLAIVLDRSGSMSGDKLEKAKEAAVEALRRLGDGDLFSLVIYDHNVETLVPAQSAANSEWIEGRIRGIRAGGNTALYGGVSQGASEIRKHGEGRYVNRLILLSDGLANVGPSDPSDLARLGRALMKERISVSTVGVGTDYNEDLMTQLSQASDGNAYFVENSRDLPRIFQKELGDVLSVVARKVILEIEFTGGCRPIRIIGRDGRVRDNRVELELSQLYGNQQKYALVEVEVPAGKPNDERPIAEAKCVYEDAVHDRQEVTRGSVAARFSESDEAVKKSVNVDVQQGFLVNEYANAKDQAIQLIDQGKKEDAANVLRAFNKLNVAQQAQYDLPPQAAVPVAQVEQEAKMLERQGLDNVGRKSFRTDSYQIRNQQQLNQ